VGRLILRKDKGLTKIKLTKACLLERKMSGWSLRLVLLRVSEVVVVEASFLCGACVCM